MIGIKKYAINYTWTILLQNKPCVYILRTRGQHFEDFIAQGPHRSPDEQQQTDMSDLNSFNKPKMKKFLYNAGFSKIKLTLKTSSTCIK